MKYSEIELFQTEKLILSQICKKREEKFKCLLAVFIRIESAPDTYNLRIKSGLIEKRYHGKLDKNSEMLKTG